MGATTILNGKAKSHPEFEMICDASRRFKSSIQETSQPGDAATLARAAVDSGATRLVIAGGDGTINEVIQGLSPDFPAIELGVIPLGTGNDLARSLDIPIHDIPAATEMAFTSKPTPIDVVRVNHGAASYFVNAASGGFGADITDMVSASSKQAWGPLAYWMAAVEKLAEMTEYEVVMEADDRSIRERIYGLAVNNGRTVGGGFPLAPSALLNDGWLAISIVPVLPALELLAVGVDLLLGRRRESEYVESFRTRSLHLQTEPRMLFSADGEIERRVESQFDVLPGRLRFGAGPNAAIQ